MGSSNYSADSYSHLSNNMRGKSVNQVFTQQASQTIASTMSPVGVTIRESRDSVNHPESLALMVWSENTGSMGKVPHFLITEKLNGIMGTLIDHGIKDASVFFGVTGDSKCDSYPLQVGQFESGEKELVACLTSAYLEGGGGGNGGESYSWAHYFAGKHTSIDCFEKRQQKGFLFTMGDECNHSSITASEFKKVLQLTEATELTDKEMLEMAQRMYHVFHIHIIHDNNTGSAEYDISPRKYWKNLLGERLIVCSDYNNVAEIIAATVAVVHGIDLENVLSSFDKQIASNVRTALATVDLGSGTKVVKNGSGVVQL